ncbi:hypothetical protein ACHQM5_021208 [Ranunculus cassubicifolius]
MENQKKIFFSLYFLSVLLTGCQMVQGSTYHHQKRLSKLFVFGDSYADTGNADKSASSWNIPYGITFPGKPSGRYSDGRVLTDYLASYLKIRSPLPYRFRKWGKGALRYGMNFAYGGTGVFQTYAPLYPNMTIQIDFLQKLIKDRVYTKQDLSSSVAHVSVAGNDYATYTLRNGTAKGIPAFITSVVSQLTLNLKRIHSLGVRKITVTALPPFGCLPSSTIGSSYQICTRDQNQLVNSHNQLLQQVVANLNNSTKDSTFIILDLNSTFMSAFKSQGKQPGSLKFEKPLTPCCVGTSSQHSCGDIDENGVKKYTICKNPNSAFFWDSLHPTQQGWFAVYSALRGALDQLTY